MAARRLTRPVLGWSVVVLLAIASVAVRSENAVSIGDDGLTPEIGRALEEAEAVKRRVGAQRIDSIAASELASIEQLIADEVSKHRSELFHAQMARLSRMGVDELLAAQVATSTPLKVWHPLPSEDTNGVAALYDMMPLRTTPVVCFPYIPPDRVEAAVMASTPPQVLMLSNGLCRTGMAVSNTLYIVDFVRHGFRWCPREVRLYILREE